MPLTVALAGDTVFGRGVAAAARRGRPALARGAGGSRRGRAECPA